MKRLLTALAALMLFCSLAQADVLPLGGPAPYPPVASAFGEDGMSYDDGTISITIEKDVVGETNVYYAYVKLTDVSQLRTALAAPILQRPPGLVNVMAAGSRRCCHQRRLFQLSQQGRGCAAGRSCPAPEAPGTR